MLNIFPDPDTQDNKNKGVFAFITFVLIIVALIGIVAFISPTLFNVIINLLWLILMFLVGVFLILGVLVIFGLKKEVNKMLDVFVEGSLNIIDAIELLKKIYMRFIYLLQELIVFITPVLGIVLSLIIYLILMVIYKTVGQTSDVTILTIIMSVGLVFVFGLMNLPKKKVDTEVDVWSFSYRVKTLFKRFFLDSFELVIFLFFLTMDSTNLFFLPEELNVPLKAFLGDTNLMVRGFDVKQQSIAILHLVAAAIGIEIFRYLLRIAGVSFTHYQDQKSEESGALSLKKAIRQGFEDSRDDVIKFISFTTILMLVFLFFPRLKIFAMVLASVSSLILDIMFTARIFSTKGEDLISRAITKVFKL